MSSQTLQVRQSDARQVLGQLADQEKAASSQERRLEQRTDTSVGIVVVPIHNDSPDISRAFSAITKNVSTTGIGVIANCSVLPPEVVICVPDKPKTRLFRGLVLHRKELGPGWVRLGVEVTDVLDRNKYPRLTGFLESILS